MPVAGEEVLRIPVNRLLATLCAPSQGNGVSRSSEKEIMNIQPTPAARVPAGMDVHPLAMEDLNPVSGSGNSTADHARIARAVHRNAKVVRENYVTRSLIGCAQRRGEVSPTAHGALVASTGKFTGRSANDKFIVMDETTRNSVWWPQNNPMDAEHFELLMQDMLAHTTGRSIHQQQLFAGADPGVRLNVQVLTQSAWHALFIRHLLIRPAQEQLDRFAADVTILHLPDFSADPQRHGTRSSTCIALDFSRNIVLIAGTAYAGEIKKSVFTLFNFHAPESGILPMHCSANLSRTGETTLFFGLSGTGKTTLSTSPERALIGDDEHGWSEKGVFNLEGGCYAKAINLTREGEPEIFATTQMPGTILENVSVDAQGVPDFFDTSVTENTRIAYPLSAIANRVPDSMGPAPSNVVLLTADAFGVLPPLARLTREQAIYYFLSGYTAKVAGTERGVSEPQATFSACFGAPFMARHPREYGQLLDKRLQESGARIWLLNTGWTGGPYGVGERIALKTTRRMLEAALSGELDDADFRTDPAFGLEVPLGVRDVDPALLDPRACWADPEAYDAKAAHLLGLFETNFTQLNASE